MHLFIKNFKYSLLLYLYLSSSYDIEWTQPNILFISNEWSVCWDVFIKFTTSIKCILVILKIHGLCKWRWGSMMPVARDRTFLSELGDENLLSYSSYAFINIFHCSGGVYRCNHRVAMVPWSSQMIRLHSHYEHARGCCLYKQRQWNCWCLQYNGYTCCLTLYLVSRLALLRKNLHHWPKGMHK